MARPSRLQADADGGHWPVAIHLRRSGVSPAFVLAAQGGTVGAAPEAAVRGPLAAVHGAIAGLIEEGARSGIFRQIPDRELVVDLLSALLELTGRRIAIEPGKASAITTEVTTLVLRGVTCAYG